MRLALAALLLLASGPAFAQGTSSTAPDTAPVMAPAASGTAAPAATRPRGMTRDQFIQRVTENAGRHFDEMDANHDGVLEPSELRAWRQAHAMATPAAPANPPITVHSAPANQ
jgi:hypothetical protein